MKPFKTIGLLYLVSCCRLATAQVSFDLKSTPDLDFTFNSVDKYISGITVAHALDLNVSASSQWDLYIGATTTAPGIFNTVTTYSSSGVVPAVSLVQARIYNANSTPQTGAGFFPLTDIASPVYIIGSTSNDAGVDCSDSDPTGTNEPGSHLSDPSCYKFKIDLKIIPGLNCKAGLYNMRIDFILIEDL